MEMKAEPAFVDTNVLIRHLVEKPDEHAVRASRIIEETDSLLVSSVSLMEVAHVLRSQYQVAREAIVDLLVNLIRRDNIAIYAIDKDIALRGLAMCRPSGRVSIGDALIWAAARSAGASAIYTFDRRFPSEDIEIRQTL